MKKLLLAMVAAVVLSVGLMQAAEQPKSVIHVVTIKWKKEATPAQIKGALDGAAAIAGKYPGITRVWNRSIKVQGAGYSNALVMEFKDEQALKDYVDSPAQKEWYKIYLPLREESTTHDITN